MIRSEADGYVGRFNIKTYNLKDKTVKEDVVYNRVTNALLQALIQALDGISPDIEIKYLAIGDSNAAIVDTDTQLGNELFRVQVDGSDNQATGEYLTTFTILDSEAVFTWEEIGIFGGSGATGAANTGTMLSRILYNKEKTSLEEIEIQRLDKIQRN